LKAKVETVNFLDSTIIKKLFKLLKSFFNIRILLLRRSSALHIVGSTTLYLAFYEISINNLVYIIYNKFKE